MKLASVAATTPARSPTTIQPRLAGPWLWLVRVVWLSMAALLIASFLLSLPFTFAQVEQVCTGAACVEGLSPAFLAAYATVLSGLVSLAWIVMGVLLFARGPAEPRVLFFSLFLLLFGGGPNPAVAEAQPIWWLPVAIDMFLLFSCLGLFVFVFPTGRFVPRWTRWVVLVIILVDVPTYFFPNSPLTPDRWPGAVNAVGSLGLVGILIGSQVYRYRRRSTSLERQQSKWVLLALGVFLLVDITRTLVLSGATTPLWLELVFATASQLAGLLIPLAIAASILRYRLWEIDSLINKVLVYGLLTALLGGVYVGLILGLQALFSTLIGQTGAYPLVIVLSTLAIARLVLPVRRRIQHLIDRRFYRQKYDAEQTLAAFSAMLRNEVDLEQVQQQLLAVVQETMQPAHVSLWLRLPEQRTPERWRPRASGILAPAPTFQHTGSAPDRRQQTPEGGQL